MRIATWNVNSVNARLPTVLDWFGQAQPDVACLQEIKCVDDKFPREAFEDLGYNVETHRDARDMEKPSDHVPVVVDLDPEPPAWSMR